VDGPALDNLTSLRGFLPDLVLIIAVLAVIGWDLAGGPRTKGRGVVTLTLGGLAFSALSGAWSLITTQPTTALFGGLIVHDAFASVFRVLLAVVVAVVVLFVAPSDDGRRKIDGIQKNPAEFFALVLVMTLGMSLMASSANLLMIYLSIELVSLMSFVLAGYEADDKGSSEAALKYVVFGGVASAIMLYGMSFLFGISGSLELSSIAQRIGVLAAEQGRIPEVALVGSVCVFIGFGYKISAAPFHMWTPDVYEGAPTPVTALLAVGPKVAGFAVLVRFFTTAMPDSTSSPWPVAAGCIAIATMTIGNLSALKQDNLKRMLAYSSIAHAGYMLLGFSVFTPDGIAAIVFYTCAYSLMNLGAFIVVIAVGEQSGGREDLDAFRGLGRRAPIMAATMAVFLASLTGLPPLVGFVGKFYLFSAVLAKGGVFNVVLAMVGVVNSVVGFFYYARILRAMYLESGASDEPVFVRPILGKASLALAIPTLGLGLYWSPLYDLVASSVALMR
jgi:NADH-quinone oxidoreductase subunit N